MIARISKNGSRSQCAISIPPRSNNRRSSLSASRRILRKTLQKRPIRQPLAVRNISNGARREEKENAPAIPAAPFRLPRTLPRPQVGEVNRRPIDTIYPELTHVPMEYIRKNLSLAGTDMLAAVANVRAQPPSSSLPRELEIVVNDMVAAACPTHMLAIYSAGSRSGSAMSEKRKVTLFPTHHLILAAHCTNLPPTLLPASKPDVTTATSIKLPIVPLCLPSPETFSILQSYLYTKRIDTLFASLLPTPPSSFCEPTLASTTRDDMVDSLMHHLAASGNLPSLARYSMVINGVWRNACALGVRDEKLWDCVEAAWEVVVGAMGLMKGEH